MSHARARRGELWGREGEGGGDDAMFGNRCLCAHAQGTTRVVGGGGEERGGVPTPGTQYPQWLSTVATRRLPCGSSVKLVSFQH